MSGISPDNLLLYIAIRCRFCSAPIFYGSSPVKALFSKDKDIRFLNFSIPWGRVPVSKLLATQNCWILPDRLATELGSSPAKWLSLIMRICNWVEFARESKNWKFNEVVEEKKLLPRIRWVRFFKLLIIGMGPWKLLWARSMYWRCEALDMKLGINPSNLLLAREIFFKLGRTWPKFCGK